MRHGHSKAKLGGVDEKASSEVAAEAIKKINKKKDPTVQIGDAVDLLKKKEDKKEKKELK